MVSTAHSYASLQRRLDAIFVWVKESTPGFCGYASKDVATRLIQRWAELSVFEFTRIAAESYRKSGHLPDDVEIINCAGLLIEGTRKFRLTPLRFMALFLDFIGYWCYVLLMIMISLVDWLRVAICLCRMVLVLCTGRMPVLRQLPDSFTLWLVS